MTVINKKNHVIPEVGVLLEDLNFKSEFPISTYHQAIDNGSGVCIAPTYWEVLDWLLSNYKIVITLNVSELGYYCDIYSSYECGGELLHSNSQICENLPGSCFKEEPWEAYSDALLYILKLL